MDEVPKIPNMSSFLSLLPGSAFFPSDEQLLYYYLAKKNSTNSSRSDESYSDSGFNVIKDVNIYNYEPFDLPDTMSFSHGCGGRRRHWYCYVSRVWSKGGKRRAGSGFWKRKGRVRDVMGMGGKVVLGKRQSFVFYYGDSSSNPVSTRTDWVMHEYALTDHSEVSFVLCRVFLKFRSQKNTSDHALSSCAEESVATVKHIGIQHDETIMRGNAAKARYNDFVDEINEIIGFPVEHSSELNDQVTAVPVSNEGFQHSLGISPHILFSSTEHASDGVGLIDTMPTQQLISMLQEDFIELDDFVRPLLEVD